MRNEYLKITTCNRSIFLLPKKYISMEETIWTLKIQMLDLVCWQYRVYSLPSPPEYFVLKEYNVSPVLELESGNDMKHLHEQQSVKYAS